jgi:hypothetical protein
MNPRAQDGWLKETVNAALVGSVKQLRSLGKELIG